MERKLSKTIKKIEDKIINEDYNDLLLDIDNLNRTLKLKDFKIWCCECDIEMESKGTALDCPKDGIFYICPSCEKRIVII